MATKRPKPKQEFEETKRARLALKHAKASAENFYSAFESVRKARGASGAPTDGDQDLIRAAVVFAAGGLDITVKELIRGSIGILAANDSDVQAEFEKFTRKQLRSENEIGGKADPSKFLAQLLVSPAPYDRLIENYIYDLTGSSLQSTDELFKAAAALDINDTFLKSNKLELTAAFKVRNDIIHELDVNFSGGAGQRKRKSRTKPNLEEHTNLFLEAASYFVDQVNKKIEECT